MIYLQSYHYDKDVFHVRLKARKGEGEEQLSCSSTIVLYIIHYLWFVTSFKLQYFCPSSSMDHFLQPYTIIALCSILVIHHGTPLICLCRCQIVAWNCITKCFLQIILLNLAPLFLSCSSTSVRSNQVVTWWCNEGLCWHACSALVCRMSHMQPPLPAHHVADQDKWLEFGSVWGEEKKEAKYVLEFLLVCALFERFVSSKNNSLTYVWTKI